MNWLVLKYLASQEGLWVRFGFGITLIVAKFLPWLGWLALIAGVHKAWRLIHDTPNLDDLLKVAEQKRAFGLQRELSELENKKILELLRYTKLFVSRGGDPSAAESLHEHAWQLLKEGDAGDALASLLTSLPPLSGGPRGDRESLLKMLDREAAIIRASELEVHNAVRSAS